LVAAANNATEDWLLTADSDLRLIDFSYWSRYIASAWTTQKNALPIVPLLLRVDSLLPKRVYDAIA
jgi:hypothetical protein